MTTITIDEEIKLEKTHFKKLEDFMVNVNIISYKTKKLSPVEIITKYNLNKEYI